MSEGVKGNGKAWVGVRWKARGGASPNAYHLPPTALTHSRLHAFTPSLSRAFLRLAIASIAAVPMTAAPHGGLSMDEDYCKLRVGKYVMHFTGYQPDNTTTKEFCEDIPQTGRTIVVLDYLNQELRDLPAEVRIIKDTGAEAPLDQITVLHLPPKVYPSGTVHFEHRFDQPGKFVGLVTVNDPQPVVSRFPFSVSASRSRVQGFLPAIAAIVAGVVLYWFAMHKREQANKGAA